MFTGTFENINFKANVDHLFETTVINQSPNKFIIDVTDNEDNLSFVFKNNTEYKVVLKFFEKTGNHSHLGTSTIRFK